MMRDVLCTTSKIYIRRGRIDGLDPKGTLRVAYAWKAYWIDRECANYIRRGRIDGLVRTPGKRM